MFHVLSLGELFEIDCKKPSDAQRCSSRTIISSAQDIFQQPTFWVPICSGVFASHRLFNRLLQFRHIETSEFSPIQVGQSSRWRSSICRSGNCYYLVESWNRNFQNQIQKFTDIDIVGKKKRWFKIQSCKIRQSIFYEGYLLRFMAPNGKMFTLLKFYLHFERFF